MSDAQRHYRLDGIYLQRQKGFLMQRIKLPGGMLSAIQAKAIAGIAERHARGMVHLTTRGSIELHWLTEDGLAPVAKQFAMVGLVSRGACGGAVRGVTSSGIGTAGSPRLEAMVRRLHRHFTGNPRFESLPKKFKIAVEPDISSGRHLIQDIALVPTQPEGEVPRYDVWAAGGLGREPSPGFLLAEGVAETNVIPLIEAVLRIYRIHTPAGKRLKHLVRETGREVFRQMVFADTGASEELPLAPTLSETVVGVVASPALRLEIPFFAGEVKAADLALVAAVAERFGGGMVLVTSDQNLVIHLEQEDRRDEAEKALSAAGLGGDTPRDLVRFRVCPGTHECLMGLAPTREVAEAMVAQMGAEAMLKTWAISGCPNCCAQPQLAERGVVASKLTGADGERSPRFDLYRKGEEPFAVVEAQGLTLDELLKEVKN
ncbi:nitrite/sulfite reductase [Geomesophilobacter sediminis]|uniref:Nitrite/sulfite reductase n=1 Tax=Geomesophilobacter sediminis TaxID=2798584 RepID=A0A8J7LZI4_9BACT|nr:nitrite/sulfite reductase [Geomesophilobacter sediminis]MBJ6726466.1 nitrite/sulfite reductase [Geomesophilobacter sediminis]